RCRTKLMDTLRGEVPRAVPGHEHDERVAGRRGQRAVRLLLSVDAAEDVRSAIDGQIKCAATQAVDLAPRRVETPEMRPERMDSLPQGIDRPGRRLAGHPGAEYRLTHQDGERSASVRHRARALPALQDVLRLLQVDIATRIDSQN